MKYCCNQMQYEIESNKVDNSYNHKIIEYDPIFRGYDFILKDHPNGTHLSIYYCPWCGAKIPNDLGEEWFDILEKEYGLKEPEFNDKRVPEEFKTDEWWKKRGL